MRLGLLHTRSGLCSFCARVLRSIIGSALNLCLIFLPNPAVCQSLPADVRRVLEREEQGDVIDRRKAITSDTPVSNWHRGIVLQNGKPIEIENLKLTEQEKEYRDQRQGRLDDQQHIELAQWCERQRQPERMRAHLQVVLKKQPNNTALRALLRHRFVDGRWYSPFLLERAKKKADERVKALVAWLPKISRIAQQCQSRNSAVKRRALDALAGIKTPQSSHAMEAIVYGSSADIGEVLVNRLADFSSVDCCLSLARIALDDAIPPSVAGLAERHLIRYDSDLYVPELLSLLQVKQSQMQLTTMPTGDLVLDTLVVRELADRKELMRLRKYFVVGEPVDLEADYIPARTRVAGKGRTYGDAFRTGAFNYGDPDLNRLGEAQQQWMVNKERDQWSQNLIDGFWFRDTPGFRSPKNPYGGRGDIRADEAAFLQSVKSDQAILQSQLARAERRIKALNQRVIQLLHRTQLAQASPTDDQISTLPTEDSDVESWWDWWAMSNDQFVGIKRSTEQRALIIEGAPNPGTLPRGPKGRSRGFCFVAGTPVQTSRGLAPIEDLAIGDHVLAQDVESGELALKPVFEVFRRPAANVFEIAFGNERITSTSGHFWWVVGKGWMRTRELQVGMKLRTARSVVRIDEALKLPLPANSYNVRVADFGTIFIGDERVLCSDSKFPRPTMRSLPGFGEVGP